MTVNNELMISQDDEYTEKNMRKVVMEHRRGTWTRKMWTGFSERQGSEGDEGLWKNKGMFQAERSWCQKSNQEIGRSEGSSRK